MAKVTFFTGLCGSGKSHESKKLEKQYLKREEKVEMFREVLSPNIEPQIIQTLKDGIDCIVEEAFYCIPGYRNIILQMLEQVPEAEIKWVIFDNDLEAANWNVRNRPYDDTPADFLVKLNEEKFHPDYDAGDITTKPIFRIQPK